MARSGEVVKTVRIEGKAQTSAIRRALKDVQSATQQAGRSAGQASGQYASFGARLDDMGKRMEGTRRRLDQLTKVMGAAGLVGVAVGAVKSFDALVTQSQRLQDVMGNLPIGIGAAKKATQGLATDFDLAKSAAQAVRLGVVKNSQEFAKLAEIATKLGRSVGMDAGTAVEDLTTALARQSPMILDNLGISLKLEDAYKQYAAQLGKSADQLTDAEKKQAFLTVAMQKGEEAAKNITLTLDKGTESWLRMKTAASDFASNAIPEIMGGVFNLTDSFLELIDVIGATDAVIKQLGAASTGPGVIGVLNRARGIDPRAVAEAAREAEIAGEKELRRAELEVANRERDAALRRQALIMMQRKGARGRGAEAIDLGSGSQGRFAIDNREAENKILEELLEQEQAILERRKEAADRFMEREFERHEKKIALIEAEKEARKRAAEEEMRIIEFTSSQIVLNVSRTSQLANLAAEVGIVGRKKAAGFAAWAGGFESAVIAATEAVKAAAAYASYNFPQGAAHTAAAAFATAQSVLLFAKAAGAGAGGGAFSVGQGGFGGAFAGASFGGGGGLGGPQSAPAPANTGPNTNVPRSGDVPPPLPRSGGGGQRTVIVNLTGVIGDKAETGQYVKQAIREADMKFGTGT